MLFCSKMAKTDVLFRRKDNTHKGDYGHILILAGSAGFSGAAVLCANAAMRCGAGIVSLGVPEGVYSIIAKKSYPEVMVKPLAETKERTLSLKAYSRIMALAQKADLLAIGPGLSQNSQTQKLVLRIIRGSQKPLVIDADGLNALCGHLDILRITNQCGAKRSLPVGDESRLPVGKAGITILTPHPGEFSRLIGRPLAYVQKNREMLAKRFASDYNIILILKGHRAIVASPDGKAYVNKTGNPGMAGAGSGDVLTGMVAALLGQGLSGFEAARLGVYLHGLAGDLAAKEKTQAGMIASDIIENIPEAIKHYSSGLKH